MTRKTIVRVVVVLLIVVPPLGLFQWSTRVNARLYRNEQAIRAQARESRCAQVEAAETLIRIVKSSPPALFTARDRLLLTRFVQDAGRELQASVPSCP